MWRVCATTYIFHSLDVATEKLSIFHISRNKTTAMVLISHHVIIAVDEALWEKKRIPG